MKINFVIFAQRSMYYIVHNYQFWVDCINLLDITDFQCVYDLDDGLIFYWI